jgi:hypothetical protein
MVIFGNPILFPSFFNFLIGLNIQFYFIESKLVKLIVSNYLLASFYYLLDKFNQFSNRQSI